MESAVVISIYQRLLLRDPTSDELRAGISAVDASGREAFEAALAQTPEATIIAEITLPIIGLYQGILLRTPEADGLAFWSNAITSGDKTFADLIADFAATSEVQARFPSLGDEISNEELVLLFYDNILARIPDAPGFNFWLEKLNSGNITAAEFVSGFIGSSEAQTLIGANLRAYIADISDGQIDNQENRDSLVTWNGLVEPVS